MGKSVGKLIYLGEKKLEYYKEILIHADYQLHEQVSNLLVRKVPKGKILDWGAGDGALSQRLTDLGYEVEAVDINKEKFQSKHTRFTSIDFNQPELIESFVGQKKDYYDAVLGVEVIEHIENPWKYARSLKTMLKPGGTIVITTPNISSWLSRCLFFFKGRFHQFDKKDLQYGHINPISPFELNYILDHIGMVKIEIIPGGTLPPIYLTKWWKLWLLNVMALMFRPFMRGESRLLDGWCVIAVAKKPDHEQQ